ncbi:vanadium-dependent haloperoxidase [Lysobacter sp. Root494]|uniref:vanadium-dependent haloperoxidase n=1 Tax=Lysobacter sp. Root494 TaxID=1736549 RepID=UPI0006FC2CF7|nr:vanadium-dependent haloperoxidase [Lysobacter sp. Root494]KQY50467.1 hypothetical protein ASD14_12200 [Lysobacter sp. Root494]
MKATHAARRAVSHRYLLPLALAVALVMAMPAKADSVTDWNGIAASPQVLARFGAPQFQFRAMAIVQVAVHDALNTIQPRYQTYDNLPAAAAGASPDAAVAAATRTALLGLFSALAPAPNQPEADARAAAIAMINNEYAARIAALGGAGVADGIAAGEAAARSCLLQRHTYDPIADKYTTNDGAQAAHSVPYTLAAASGVHQPTPAPEFPAVTLPLFTGWKNVALFSLNSASQFRAPWSQLFDLSSQFYANQYNEVKHLGDARVRGAFPNSQQTDIARFWPAGGLDWNANIRVIVQGRGLDRWQHARLFALANMSVHDSGVTNQESKYYWHFWRPVTAIRWLDDGNPDTQSDPFWRPFMQTPPYPDYPCGSTSVTGAVTQTLRNFFGTNAIGFSRTVSAPAVPLPAPMTALATKTITRKYNSLSIAENEQARARVYEGFHFAEGCYVGLKSANQVANWVYTHELRAL